MKVVDFAAAAAVVVCFVVKTFHDISFWGRDRWGFAVGLIGVCCLLYLLLALGWGG